MIQDQTSQAVKQTTLPNPNVRGECQIQASPFCEPGAGRQRMNPTDMLQRDTAFQDYASICDSCYDHQADAYVAELHTDDRDDAGHALHGRQYCSRIECQIGDGA